MNTNLLFTPSGVFDLLNQIDELKDYDIQLAEVGDSVVLQVGESIYNIAGDVYEVQAPGASVAAINTYDEEVSDGLENAESKTEELLGKAYTCLTLDKTEHNAYYRFVLDKCIPAFDYYGHIAESMELRKRMNE